MSRSGKRKSWSRGRAATSRPRRRIDDTDSVERGGGGDGVYPLGTCTLPVLPAEFDAVELEGLGDFVIFRADPELDMGTVTSG